MDNVLSWVREMPPQKRPSGPSYPVDEAWKANIQKEMEKQGISPAELARRIRVTPSAITVLFRPAAPGRPATKETRLAPKIYKALGMVDDAATLVAVKSDDSWKRLVRAWSKMGEEERKNLLATGELLASKR